MDFLKKYKKIIVSLFSILVAIYLAFLFVVPNVININNYKKDIQKIVYDTAKIKFDFESIKIITTPTLKAGVNAKGLKISYPNGQGVASLKEGEVKISLLHLLLMKLQVSDIFVDSPVLNLTMLKNGQLDIVDYVMNNMSQSETTEQVEPQDLPIKISDKLPTVNVKNYAVKLVDERSKNSIVVSGKDFCFDKAIINKHFRITSKGAVLINNIPNINYDVKVMSFWPVITATSEPAEVQELPQIDIIKELVKFDPKADIFADISIKERAGSLLLDGYFNADKISLKLAGKKLPDSFFHLLSKGTKTNIETDLYINSSEKVDVDAILSHGKKLKIDLNVKTEQISFVSIKDFLEALLNSLYINNDLKMFNTKGFIKADFSVKTDLKKIKSDGYFKVLDGYISHKSIPIVISSILADIDFSNNSLNIKNTGMNINGAQINVEGAIDSKSNTDIVVSSDDINIAPLYNAFAPKDIKSICGLNSGIFNINITAKGKLDKIQPTINALLKNFVLKTKYPMPIIAVSTKEAKINVTPTEIKIIPFDLLINSSKVIVSGGVKDYLSNMKIDILADGSFVANDIKNMLPKEVGSFISSKGSIPFKGLIRGDLNKIDVTAQAYTNASAHFSPISVKRMVGKPGLVNFSAVFAGDKLNINDASMYISPKTVPADKFELNKKGAVKVLGLTGHISDLSTSHPVMKLNFSVPENLILSTDALPNTTLKARGDLDIAGDISRIENLLYKGYFTVNDVNVPALLTKVQNADIEFNGDTITAKVQNLNLNDTTLNIDALASTKFTNVFLIKSMNVTSAQFDVDKLFKVMDKMNELMPPANTQASSVSSSNSLMLPVKISNGKLDIKKFVMKQIGGNLDVSDISGDFTLVNDLFKLNNLKATAFKGNINGNVTYNLKTTAVTAKIKGQKIDANPAVTVFVALKDQMMGNVDFNADVSLKGATYEEQMKTLNGKVDFELKDGQMGSLGSFETFLKADNLLTQSFISSKVGNVISTIAPYKTGKFSYLNGIVNIHNGVASLDPVKMSGPHMALLLTGNVNILTMVSNLQILGYLSSDIMGALGPVGDLSLDKFASYIPTFGSKITSVFNAYNQAMKQADLDKIPALTPSKTNARAFKVVLNGNLYNPPAAIKKFQWLNTPEKIAEEQSALKEATTVKVPVTKEEIKEQIKTDVKQGITNAIQNNEKVQELQKNSTVKSLTDIYKFYKNSGASQNAE